MDRVDAQESRVVVACLVKPIEVRVPVCKAQQKLRLFAAFTQEGYCDEMA
jgi:hypothetical protein